MKKDQLESEILMQIENYISQENTTKPNDKSKLLREIFDSLAKKINTNYDLLSIDAPNAVLEVVDAKTGFLFRRYLELEFNESENGLRLTGENLNGEEVSIVYLSESAIVKIHDLKGSGADKNKCD